MHEDVDVASRAHTHTTTTKNTHTNPDSIQSKQHNNRELCYVNKRSYIIFFRYIFFIFFVVFVVVAVAVVVVLYKYGIPKKKKKVTSLVR